MADGLSLLPLGVSSWFATRPGEKAEKGGAVAIREDVGAFLVSHADEGYRAFQAKLIPNIDAATIVGVRTPELRQFAKGLARREVAEAGPGNRRNAGGRGLPPGAAPPLL